MKEFFLNKFGLFPASRRKRDQGPLLNNIQGRDALCRFIVESAHDAIYIIGKDCRVEYANAKTAADFHLTAEEVVGKSMEELFPGETFKRISADVEQVFRTCQPLSFEDTMPFGDKQVRTSTALVPLLDGDGGVSSVLGISRNIADRRGDGHSFVAPDELYRALIETSPDAITVTDLEGKIVKASKKALEVYGFDREEELMNLSIFEFIAPEDRERARLNLLKTLEQGTAWNGEYLLKRRNGTYFFGELNSSVVRDSRGKPRAFVGVTRDITGYKRTEKALQESERRYRELWDNAPVAYHTLDTKGVITRVNHTEARMLGYFVEEMVGKPVFNFILPGQRQDARERFQQKKANQNVSKSENRVYVRKDGSPVSVSIDDMIEYDE
ncbi:MAG: PAS domain S-box protein, partial [Endomicrobiales bacterium]